MAINVCFSTTNGLLSRTIRWFTRSRVSHSIITFEDSCLAKVFVMEANGRGFMLVPWSKWKKYNKLVVRYELSVSGDEQLVSLQGLANSLGAEYDYLSLLGFIFRRFAKRMSNPLNDSKKLICSEAVAKFLYGAGYKGFSRAETFTPEDIYEIAQKDETFVKVE